MKKIILFSFGLLLFTGTVSAQWVVTDPSNLAQGIVNTTKQIVETSQTATNTLKGFQETVKIYEQGKAYYDALKSVNNLVRDARKVQKTILMVSEITDIYVTNFQAMLADPNFTADELTGISYGYARLLEESSGVLDDLRTIINPSTLSLSDAERMAVIDRCYRDVSNYRNLVSYYTQKNISVSYLRAKKKNDTDRVMALYGNANERYW